MHAMFVETIAPPGSPYTRKNPFPAKVLVNRRLNPYSQKDTRHFELDLTDSGLSYEAGDSMAIYPSNDPALVDEITPAVHRCSMTCCGRNARQISSIISGVWK